ncbi:hypothetical protein [Rhodoplanes elegans]
MSALVMCRSRRRRNPG